MAREAEQSVVAPPVIVPVSPPPATLRLEPAQCCICETDDADPVGVGEDFEYRTSSDSFLAVRCRTCGLVYLDPRPTAGELDRIYPPTYHAFNFSEEQFGLAYRVRCRLEARRMAGWCRGLPDDARILDVGCGDGFHLRLLREFGAPGWQLEGVDASEHAVAGATRAGLTVHHGRLEDVPLPEASYHLILVVATIEHVDDPVGLMRRVGRLLRPGGQAVVVTDNVDTVDFALSRGRYWGGYHFPRHWNLFSPATIRRLAARAGLETVSAVTVMSPVNWVYSVRNALVDADAPSWLVNRFSLSSPLSLAVFTVFDALHSAVGKGALLRATLRRPST